MIELNSVMARNTFVIHKQKYIMGGGETQEPGGNMDIYAIAEQYGDADYYDMASGNTYLIQKWNQAKRSGLPDLGIGIVNSSGEFIGYAKRPEEEDKPKREPRVYSLECGINKSAPGWIRGWFVKAPLFILSKITTDAVTFSPADPESTSPRLTIHGFDNLSELVESGLADYPDYICFRYRGGNAHGKKGGYSISIIAKDASNKTIPSSNGKLDDLVLNIDDFTEEEWNRLI